VPGLMGLFGYHERREGVYVKQLTDGWDGLQKDTLGCRGAAPRAIEQPLSHSSASVGGKEVPGENEKMCAGKPEMSRARVAGLQSAGSESGGTGEHVIPHRQRVAGGFLGRSQ
jgi:hypothetical protein